MQKCPAPKNLVLIVPKTKYVNTSSTICLQQLSAEASFSPDLGETSTHQIIKLLSWKTFSALHELPLPGEKLFQISFKTKQRICFGACIPQDFSRPDGSTAKSLHLLCPPTPVRFQHHVSNVTIFRDCQALQFKKSHQGRRIVSDPHKCGLWIKVEEVAPVIWSRGEQHSSLTDSDYSDYSLGFWIQRKGLQQRNFASGNFASGPVAISSSRALMRSGLLWSTIRVLEGLVNCGRTATGSFRV